MRLAKSRIKACFIQTAEVIREFAEICIEKNIILCYNIYINMDKGKGDVKNIEKTTPLRGSAQDTLLSVTLVCPRKNFNVRHMQRRADGKAMI